MFVFQKIRNLEDDIALSLSALGIRIIAPIPGKVLLVLKYQTKNITNSINDSVIASKVSKKLNTNCQLYLEKPLANEVFTVDLCTTPYY